MNYPDESEMTKTLTSVKAKLLEDGHSKGVVDVAVSAFTMTAFGLMLNAKPEKALEFALPSIARMISDELAKAEKAKQDSADLRKSTLEKGQAQ